MVAEKTASTDVLMGETQRLHLQSMAELVELAGHFRSDIVLDSGSGVEADAKSLMQVFLFLQRYGNAATVRARGADAAEAVEAIRLRLTGPQPRVPAQGKTGAGG